MIILLTTTAIVALAMLALGLGVALGRRALRGSCGGDCACPGAERGGACARRAGAPDRGD